MCVNIILLCGSENLNIYVIVFGIFDTVMPMICVDVDTHSLLFHKHGVAELSNCQPGIW